MERLETPKAQAFGVAIAVTAILAIVGFIAFGGHVGPYGELFGLREEEKPDKNDASNAINNGSASASLLYTAERTKRIATSCTPGTDTQDLSHANVSISLSYPRLCDPLFDGTVQYVAEMLADNFEGQVDDVESARPGVSRGYQMELQGNSLFANDRLASVLLGAYVDTGGAHGTILFYSVNVDRSNQHRLQLADIFDSNTEYLDYIAARARSELASILGAESVFLKGLAPTESNFRVFTLNDSSITFHFPPYQVAAYAAGPQSVTIPYQDLGPYWRSE